MPHRLLLGVVLAAAGLATADCAASTPGAFPPPPRPPWPIIVQDDAELLHRTTARVNADLALLRHEGVDWVRITAGWSVIAPAPDALAPPRFDARDPAAYPAGAWRALDRAVRAIAAHGMGAVIDVAFWAPRWAVRRGLQRGEERWGPDARAYAAFAEAVARRYSGRVPGLPRAAALTIWNEPNLGAFLLPQWARDAQGRWQPASPAIYGAMVRAAYPAMKRAAPAVPVLVGGTRGVGPSSGRTSSDAMSPLRFLRELACVDGRLRPRADGACAHFTPLPGDGWAHHPYSIGLRPDQRDPDPDHVRLADLPRLVALLRRLAAMHRLATPMDVWITEYGIQTNPPDPTQPWTPAEQAALLPQAEAIARATPGVRSFAQFLLRDLPERPGRTAAERWRDFQSGLLFVDGRPKPALAALRRSLVATPQADGSHAPAAAARDALGGGPR